MNFTSCKSTVTDDSKQRSNSPKNDKMYVVHILLYAWLMAINENSQPNASPPTQINGSTIRIFGRSQYERAAPKVHPITPATATIIPNIMDRLFHWKNLY